MGVRYVKDFEFPREHGFTGSAGKSHVKAHMRNQSTPDPYDKGGHAGHTHMHKIIDKAGHPEHRHMHGHHEGHKVLAKAKGGTVRQKYMKGGSCKYNYAEGGTAEKEFLQEKKHEVLEKDERTIPEYKYRKDSGDKVIEKKRGGKVSANSTFDEAEDRKTMNRFDKNDRRVAQDDGAVGHDGSTGAARNFTDFKHGGRMKKAKGGDVKVPGSHDEDHSPMKLAHSRTEKGDRSGPEGGMSSNKKRESHAEHPRGAVGANTYSDGSAPTTVKQSDPKLGLKGQKFNYAFGGLGRNPRANAAIHAKTRRPGGGRGIGALSQAAGPSMGALGAPPVMGGAPPAPAMGGPPAGMQPPPMRRGGRA